MSDLLDDHQRGLLRALLYPILFEPYPTDGVERVLRQVVYAKAMNAQPEEYLAAVQAALQSGDVCRSCCRKTTRSRHCARFWPNSKNVSRRRPSGFDAIACCGRQQLRRISSLATGLPERYTAERRSAWPSRCCLLCPWLSCCRY